MLVILSFVSNQALLAKDENFLSWNLFIGFFLVQEDIACVKIELTLLSKRD